MRTPSIKTLRTIFGDKAPEAKRILQMTRAQLEQLPAGDARVRECYNPPATYDARPHCLDALGGFHGVEGFLVSEKHGYCEFLNTGDTYTPTLLYFRGRYSVGCFGDIVERYEHA